MALNVLNKNFLSLLHKLDVDLTQFQDKTFDGLFDNVPDGLDYFFDWFLNNITSANALTKLEEGAYFELENNGLLPTNEEVIHFLNTSQPSFEEVQTLDPGHIKISLPEDLNRLNETYERLFDLSERVKRNRDELRKKENSARETMNVQKNRLKTAVDNCRKTISAFLGRTIPNVKEALLEEVTCNVGEEICRQILQEEKSVFHEIITPDILSDEETMNHPLLNLTFLEENLSNAEVLIVLSKGLLESKQSEFKALEKFFQDASEQNNFDGTKELYINPEESDSKIISSKFNEIKILESELLKRINNLSFIEIQKLINNYFLLKRDVCVNFSSELLNCQRYLRINNMKRSWIYHFLQYFIAALERKKVNKQECLSKLNQHAISCHTNVRKFELKRKKFEEISSRTSEYPFIKSLKNVTSLGDNPTVTALMKQSLDCSQEELKCLTDLQTGVKAIVDSLCGPTSQIVSVPVELSIKFHKCKRSNEELSKEIKRLVNEYLETKESISKTDRQELLLWIHFLTDPTKLKSIINGHQQSVSNNQ